MSAAAADKVPLLFVDQLTLDFGTVRAGKVVTHDVVIHNRGEAPLKILKIRSACGCTVTKLEPSTIAPGKTANLNVLIDTKGRQGKFKKPIYLTTNDPQHKAFMCWVEGTILNPVTSGAVIRDIFLPKKKSSLSSLAKRNATAERLGKTLQNTDSDVEEENDSDRKPALVLYTDDPVRPEINNRQTVEVDPSALYFLKLERGRPSTQSLKVRNTTGGKLEIKEVRSTLKWIMAEVVNRIAGEAEIAITVTGDAPAGPFLGRIFITISDAALPQQVRVSGNIKKTNY